MKKHGTAVFALLFLLMLCLGAGLGVLAARWQEAKSPATPAPEAQETPASAPESTPSVSPEDCGHPAYENGACVLCGHVCEHPFHDTEGLCLLCGEKVVHHYINGYCSCGAQPDLRRSLLPDRFYEPCGEEGAIVNWSYESVQWGTEIPVTVNVDFYVPYDYDPAKPYNVLVLLHGLRTTEESWLDETLELWDGRFFEMRWVYDRMIAEKLIDPLIIVSASQYLVHGNTQYKSSYEQMAAELQGTILPYTAQFLSTYAEGCDAASLMLAREHFAIGGNSWGSYYTYDTGMCQSLPYFASFLCFSGDAATAYVVQSLESDQLRDYPIRLYYAAAGDTDVARDGEEKCFYDIVPRVGRLVDGQNAFYHVCEGGHDWGTWSIEIYNALQFLF